MDVSVLLSHESWTGIGECWEDALRDRSDVGWCWKMGEVLQKSGQGICSDFLAALEGLCIFDLLHKISLNMFPFAV